MPAFILVALDLGVNAALLVDTPVRLRHITFSQIEPRRRDEDGQRPGQEQVEGSVLRVPQPRGPKGEEGHARRQKERPCFPQKLQWRYGRISSCPVASESP